MLPSALLVVEAFVLAPFPPFLFVDRFSILRLSLPPSLITSSLVEEHPGLQLLSSAQLATDMLLGNGVELGPVAELLVNEVGAVGHLNAGEVTAAFRVAIDLLVPGLVGIQNEHQVLRLGGLSDEGERVVEVAIIIFMVEEEHNDVIKGLEVIIGLLDYCHLQILTPIEL